LVLTGLGEPIRSFYESRLRQCVPDVSVVIGDTMTSYSAAMASRDLHIPIAHIEAGARPKSEGILEDVFREEIDKVSSLRFCENGALQ